MSLDTQIEFENEETLQVRLTGVTRKFANSLRRICIEDIPTMTPEELVIYVNTSQMDDEKLAHRLGQVPFLSQHAGDFNYPEDCVCDPEQENYCDKCGVEYNVHVRNSPEVKDTPTTYRRGKNIIVTTHDLRPANPATPIQPADTDLTHRNLSKSLYLCTLEPGEELKLKFIVRKGTARRSKHHKFQAVSTVGLKSPAIIRIDQEKIRKLTHEQREAIAQTSGEGFWIHNVEKGELKTADNPNDSRKCRHSQRPVELVAHYGQPGAIDIQFKEDYFLLTINSINSLTPREIFIQCLTQFKLMLEHVQQQLYYAQST